MKQRKTSWQNVSGWYNKETRDQGHYYHEHVILPRVKKLLGANTGDRVLDLACGNGVFARQLPKAVDYLGVDLAPGLIEAAGKHSKNPHHTFVVGDITRPLTTLKIDNHNTKPILPLSFSHAVCILAIQNVQHPEMVIENAATMLKSNGTFIIVMNHPCFRIPRQSSWGIDDTNKLQYRKINRYMSPLEIPMTMHPGRGKQSPVTWSYHFPLSSYITWLKDHSFVISELQEWTSDKVSEGSAKKMEDRSRNEIPLFLTIVAKKISSDK